MGLPVIISAAIPSNDALFAGRSASGVVKLDEVTIQNSTNGLGKGTNRFRLVPQDNNLEGVGGHQSGQARYERDGKLHVNEGVRIEKLLVRVYLL